MWPTRCGGSPRSSREAWIVGDVTADLQAIANGTTSDFGWYVVMPNRNIVASEHVNDELRPALFIGYTPEPATLAMVAMGGLAMLRRRRGQG